jgi:KUP system potassium uptake protein
LPVVIALFGALGIVDLAFLASNALKVVEGGWLPLMVAGAIFIIMDTWRQGRRVHQESVRDASLPLPLFLARADKTPQRVAGTAVFLAPRLDVAPSALLHSLKHYKVLHERIILASVVVENVPFVPAAKRIEVEKAGKGFFEVRIHYGFFETPNVPAALQKARALGLVVDVDSTTFFVGRETLVAGEHPGLKQWRIALYTWLASNALAPAKFYRLPPNRVVELGTQITI